ncbi:hypothetical protein SEA_FEDE_48 [Microbacterium phage Fede]|nr:hypothetical protein SEA_FEDE_48 [Microbacterium phage Fede]
MTEEQINIPVIEDLPDDIEVDDDIQSSPEFMEAVRRAQTGQYEHTMFEMWEDILFEARAQVDGAVSIPLANGLLRQWPWLQFKTLPEYFKRRLQCIDEAIEILHANYPKPAELLYQESAGDWELHKDAYIDVLVAWTQLSNHWSDQWEEIPMTRPDKPIMHAVVSDMTALLINPSTGLAEQLRNLADFNITEEESEEMHKRIAGVSDD